MHLLTKDLVALFVKNALPIFSDFFKYLENLVQRTVLFVPEYS